VAEERRSITVTEPGGETRERSLCSHGRLLSLDDFVWVGIQHNQWPVQAFASADQAARWIGDNPKERHVYKLAATPLAELRYVPPVEASYEEVDFTDGD